MSDEKKQLIYNLEAYKNKIVYIKFIGGREVIGKMVSFDTLQNLVLCNPEKEDITWNSGKSLICIGSSIVSISKGIPLKMPYK